MHRWALLLVLLVPSASANLCVEWVGVDWRQTDADIEHGLLYFGNPARDLRQAIDSDRNGIVSSSEVRAYETSLAAAATDCGDAFGFMEVEGDAPRHVSLSFDVDAAGSASTSRENLQATATVTATWVTASGSTQAEVRFEEALKLGQAASCVDGALASWFWADHWCGQSPSDGAQGIDRFIIRGGHLQPTIEPSVLASAWGNGEFVFTSSQASTARSQAILVTSAFPDEPESSLLLPTGPLIGGAMVGLLLAALGLAFAMESSRIRLWRWLGFLGFTRIRGHEALRNEQRRAILDLVRDEPGLSFTDIRRRRGLGNGATVHHLRILEREGFIRQVREGTRVRYLPSGMQAVSTPYLTDVQRMLWSAVEDHPGRSQIELASALDLPRATVRYNANVLHRHGLIRVETHGSQKHHYPSVWKKT